MRKLNDQQKLEIVEKYKSGKYSCEKLGREYGVRGSSINKILKVRKIEVTNDFSKLSRIYTLNENYFDKIDCEEKAYFLGLLYADGCNHTNNKYISINLQEVDKEILEKFKLAINSNKPLVFLKKTKEEYQNNYRLDISSSIIAESLRNLGCAPRKSLILKFPTEEQVPSYLIRHFIRGYFDGDGSVYNYIVKNKYKKNVYKYIRLSASIIGTREFNNGLIEVLNKLMEINIHNYKISKNKDKNTYKLSTNGPNALKFLDWMYKDATIFLQRKYVKMRECINNKIGDKNE